jgi:hypothetical protein
LRRATIAGKAIDPKLFAEVRAYEDSLVKAGMGSFKASQMGGQIVDSDSDLGESTDENEKFERLDIASPVAIESTLPSPDADEANQFV